MLPVVASAVCRVVFVLLSELSTSWLNVQLRFSFLLTSGVAVLHQNWRRNSKTNRIQACCIPSVMMGFWQPVTNLRDYLSQNPPGVTFFLCLLALAISFICLSSYSYTHTLPNPDIGTDWNVVLTSLSEFQLCEKDNESSSEYVSPVSSRMKEQENERETSAAFIETSSVTRLHLMVPLALTTSSTSASLKDLTLHTALRASQLKVGDSQTVNLTLEFLSGNGTHTCLTISAPTNLLPMRLLPPECLASEQNVLFLYVEARKQLPTESQICYSLHYKNDPTLTVMLTKEEQGVAEHHLWEVSMCLLGVCFLLCLAASHKDAFIRRYHWNEMDLQNDPLIDS